MSEKIYDELRSYLEDQGFQEFQTEVYLTGLLECDFLALKPTPKETKIRRYAFELKEKDFDKVVSQASKRRMVADYVSIVMVNTDFSYFMYKFAQYYRTLMDKGIGLIYYNEKLIEDANFFRIREPRFTDNMDIAKSPDPKLHNLWAEEFEMLDERLPKPQETLR